eukprot:g3638.t1
MRPTRTSMCPENVILPVKMEFASKQPESADGQSRAEKEEDEEEKELKIANIKAVAKAEAADTRIFEALSDDRTADTRIFEALSDDRSEGGAEIVVRHLEGVDGVVLDNVMSTEECSELIRLGEASGAFSFWDGSSAPRKDFRNADTIEMTHPDWAARIWARMAPHVCGHVEIEESQDRWEPDLTGRWEATGLNEKLLLARYQPGGHFAPHTDGCTLLSFDHRSIYSVIIYLNECETGGGETKMLKDEQLQALQKDDAGRYSSRPEFVLDSVAPRPGRALVFFHTIVHEGAAPAMGSSKYIIRTDVMFHRADPVCKTPADQKAFELYEEAKELEGEGDMPGALARYRRCFKMSPALAQIFRI